MQRINTAYFYVLASKLIPLQKIEQDKHVIEFWGELWAAEQELGFFIQNPLIPPITSHATCSALLDSIRALTGNVIRDEVLTWQEVRDIKENLSKFEISLQSDFGMRDTFIVSPKAAYSTTLLAERGETVLSEAVHDLVPSLKDDVHDGCRCLAFELPTAAAFHFFRAVEAMAKSYGEFVRAKPFSEREKRGGLGSYSNLLKETSLAVDQRITNAIDQLAGLHRNPTMHPGWHISKVEILATLGMSVSVIETMALDWNRRKNTPDIPLVEILPDDSKATALLEDGNEQKSNAVASAVRPSDEENTSDLKIGIAKKVRSRATRSKEGRGSGS
jgi:hypothetical protein